MPSPKLPRQGEFKCIVEGRSTNPSMNKIRRTMLAINFYRGKNRKDLVAITAATAQVSLDLAALTPDKQPL